MRLERDGDRWALQGSWYRLSGTRDGAVGLLDDRDGGRWADLRWLAAADTTGGEDETFGVRGPEVDAGGRLVWQLESSRWTAKRLVLEARPETLTIHVEVEGDADAPLTAVTLLGGRVVTPRASGMLCSGAWFQSLVPAAPGEPGRIVLPASGQSLGPMLDELPYATTKAALEMFVRQLAPEVMGLGITVNAVNPGVTDTGWVTEEIRADVLPRMPAGRIVESEDAARLIAWLCSDDARWITGQVIGSEGGFVRR